VYVYVMKIIQKKQKKRHIIIIISKIHISVSVSVSVAAVCCLCISYKRTDKIPYTLRKRSYVRAYVYVRSTRPYLLTPYTPTWRIKPKAKGLNRLKKNCFQFVVCRAKNVTLIKQN